VNASLANRAAAIRHYLARLDADPAVARRYSLVAARWEALRLAMNRGKTTPADDARFLELTGVLRALTAKLGLATHPGTEAVEGITDRAGFLPRDPQRIIYAETWQMAADGW
jgi:hypothetical protein